MAVPSRTAQASRGAQLQGTACSPHPCSPQAPQPQHCSSRDSPEPKQAKLDTGQQKVPHPMSPSPGVTLTRRHHHPSVTITQPNPAAPSPSPHPDPPAPASPAQAVPLPACPSLPVPRTHRWHSCQTQECRPALGRKSARPLLWIWEEKRSRRRCP